MRAHRPESWSRREFVRTLTLAGTAELLAARAAPAAAEPPPETTRLAIVQRPGICFAPQYVAEALLRAEGFSDVTYVKKTTTIENYEALASGTAHLGFGYAAALITRIDGGDPLVFVAGGHVGCQQIVSNERVQAIRDLRGKRIAIERLSAPDHIQISSILAYLGIDPRTDIEWVAHGGAPADSMRLLVEGAVDACQLSPAHPGAPRQGRWAGAARHHAGPAVVPILLLHDCGEPRFRPPVPRGHQARCSGHREGCQRVRA